MKLAIFGFAKRPQVDSQNTGRDVYERPFGVANVTINGSGGFANFRSLSPVSPTGVNLALIANAALTGSGNELSTNPVLQPLIDKQRQGPQF